VPAVACRQGMGLGCTTVQAGLAAQQQQALCTNSPLLAPCWLERVAGHSGCLPLPAPPRQLALMQAIMDHHHGSYSTELRAAAAALARREGAAQAAGKGATTATSTSAAAAEFPGSTSGSM